MLPMDFLRVRPTRARRPHALALLGALAWPIRRTSCRPRFPAASSSGWRLPARSRTTRRSITADEPTGNLDSETTATGDGPVSRPRGGGHDGRHRHTRTRDLASRDADRLVAATAASPAGRRRDRPWSKVVGDVWRERTRATFVVLAIAVGLAGFLAVLSMYAILRRELNRGYLATNPASAVLVTDAIDAGLLAAVIARDDVSDADARRVVTGRLRAGPSDWRHLTLFVDSRLQQSPHQRRDAGRWRVAAWAGRRADRARRVQGGEGRRRRHRHHLAGRRSRTTAPCGGRRARRGSGTGANGEHGLRLRRPGHAGSAGRVGRPRSTVRAGRGRSIRPGARACSRQWRQEPSREHGSSRAADGCANAGTTSSRRNHGRAASRDGGVRHVCSRPQRHHCRQSASGDDGRRAAPDWRHAGDRRHPRPDRAHLSHRGRAPRRGGHRRRHRAGHRRRADAQPPLRCPAQLRPGHACRAGVDLSPRRTGWSRRAPRCRCLSRVGGRVEPGPGHARR